MVRLFVVIMAGGAGSRFWPLSRRAHPKQLLALGRGDRNLLDATVTRIADLVPADRILIVTAEHLRDATLKAVPTLAPEQIMAEPVGRNTAPCVGWAAARIARQDPEAIMAVLPADQHIGDEAAYREVLRRAVTAAESGRVVTVGIRPTRPETGYGYIELGEPLARGVHAVRRFVEKPNRARADQFLAAGTFLWNSGMFFFPAGLILEAIRTHLPGLSAGLEALDEAARAGDEAEAAKRIYPGLPAISIDHGVMEKTEGIAVVEGDFGWSDLGSWTTAWELADKDGRDNATHGETVLVDAARNFIYAREGKLVALVGVDDLVVVDTEDALLVMPRERAQDVKTIVEELKARKDGRH